jgi:predicted transcriptional regulator
MYKANFNCIVLKDNLDFLIKQELITERTIRRDHTVFAVTQRGINVLKYFNELTKALPFIEETRRAPLLY